ncbi:hypothetical protein [Hydrogenophaga sp. BPS33]|uniref:hypothetical protein n=1 Tax=Hydrogenophaga sp. BPS33 TaxID=2651974 RepID=UPI00131F6BFD|nr:hypothetical protein [Hydrogenophaga sp. BPS33]QHE88581.1 hypothetical protein F9K07_28705 [Hydrogenophaga sp. BPS33]
MTARKRLGAGPILTAFAIWFAHFMVVWAAGEIWPHQWVANVLAWGLTVVALLALGGYHMRLKQQHAEGLLSSWSYRFACGAAAIATAAVVFSAMPSVFFLP